MGFLKRFWGRELSRKEMEFARKGVVVNRPAGMPPEQAGFLVSPHEAHYRTENGAPVVQRRYTRASLLHAKGETRTDYYTPEGLLARRTVERAGKNGRAGETKTVEYRPAGRWLGKRAA